MRDERSPSLEELPGALAASVEPADRALGTQVLVALGQRPVASALGDPDPRVQRAAAMGALSLSPSQRRRALAPGLPAVRDEAARQVLAFLEDDVDDGGRTTYELLQQARGGGADAPLAAMALARRSGEELEVQVDVLLASSDPVLRAHVARGLGASQMRDATGRLARAYLFEVDVEVRRALVTALGMRLADDVAPARHEVLSLAARLDPDRITRDAARRADTGGDAPVAPASHEVAWIRLLAAPGASLPASSTPVMATLTGVDGLARPLVFDDDGYALIGGLPPGEGHLRLASRVIAYESP